jgi:hypothetical protein
MGSPGTLDSARAIPAQAEFGSPDADGAGQTSTTLAGIIGHILDFPAAGNLAGTFFKIGAVFSGGELS